MRQAEKGFTLLEILIVITILGILASLVAVRVMDRPGDGSGPSRPGGAPHGGPYTRELA